MDFTAKDIVGMNAYEFYHLKDMHVVQVAHNDCKWLVTYSINWTVNFYVAVFKHRYIFLVSQMRYRIRGRKPREKWLILDVSD